MNFRICLSLTLFIHPNRNPRGNLDADDDRKKQNGMLPKHNSVLPRDIVPVTVILFTINFPTAKYHFVVACYTNQPSIPTNSPF